MLSIVSTRFLGFVCFKRIGLRLTKSKCKRFEELEEDDLEICCRV